MTMHTSELSLGIEDLEALDAPGRNGAAWAAGFALGVGIGLAIIIIT